MHKNISKKMLLVAICSLVYGVRAHASEDLSDISTDVEEITADSAAAKDEARAASERAIKEKEQTQDEMQKARSTKAAAQAKQKEAQAELQRAETVIQRETAHQATLKAEIKKNEADIAKSTKDIQDSNAKLAATQNDTTTLITLRDEQRTKIAELRKQQEDAFHATELAKQKYTQVKMEFDKSRAEAAATTDSVTKVKAAETKKQAQLELQTAQLKSQQGRVPNASPAAAGAVMTLARDCKVFAKPEASSQVLGTKRAGSVLHSAQAMNNWVSFPVKGGRSVFVQQACF